MNQNRFERTDSAILGARIRNRLDPRSAIPVPDSPATFLARLWTLFGPPHHVGDEGFSYHLRDRSTGLLFEAYSGASGPAYAAAPENVEALRPVLDDLDALLDRTPLADCAVEYDTEFGHYRVGASAGIPFEVRTGARSESFAVLMESAERLLQGASRDPWDYSWALTELTGVWARLPSTDTDRWSSSYESLARALWMRTFETIEQSVKAEYDRRPARSINVEALVDVALEQLRDVSPMAGIDFVEYEARYAALHVLAHRIESGDS